MAIRNFIQKTRNFLQRNERKLSGIRDKVIRNAPLINQLANMGLKALGKEGNFNILKPFENVPNTVRYTTQFVK